MKYKLIFIALGIIACVICFSLVFNSYGKSYVVGIINNLIKQQVEEIEKNYTQNIEARDKQIQDLQTRLTTYEQSYNNLRRRIINVEERLKNRKPPATTDELINRLDQLGYPPIK